MNQEVLPLNGCTDIQPIFPVGVEFTLIASDLRLLKLNTALGTDFSNSFLSIGTDSGVREPATGNRLRMYSSSMAVQVSGIIPDTTRPRVVSFDSFNLNTGQFVVTFDEPVNTATITTPVNLFQHQAEVSLPSFTLTVQSLTCEAPECRNNERITFTLPREELNRLKLTGLICLSASTCWLTIPPPGDFIRDMSNNEVEELPNGDRNIVRLLETFIEDTSGPLLETYTLNLTSRELILNFNEPVQASSFDTSDLTLQSERGVSGNELTYRLTGGVIPTSDSADIVISLSDEDVNALQSRPAVARTMASTYLTMESSTARDLSYRMNPAQAITNDNAQLVTMFESDRAPPQIRRFDLDLDSNSMTITFSEPVLLSSLSFDKLILASSRSGGVTYDLSGGTLVAASLDAESVVTFTFLDIDQTFIEVNEAIATSEIDTFLASRSGLAVDTNALTSVTLDVAQAVQVTVFTPDTSPSNIVSFSLDMNTGMAVVVFDDVIIGESFDVTALTLQSGPNRVPLEWHALGESSSSMEIDGFVIPVIIGSADLNRLKQIRNLSTGVGNTYLTAMATLANDVNNIDTIAITDGNALQVTDFTPDISRPILEGWTLDLNTGQLIMTFSETVDIQLLQPEQITILSSQGSSDLYTLTGYESLIPPDADFRFAIQFNEVDANSIKARLTLGTGRDNAFISFTRNAIEDMANNDVVAISPANSQQAAIFIADDASPVLRSFSLDANSGILRLSFDETVNAATFNVTGLAFVNRASGSTASYTLVDSLPSSVNSAVIEVQLSLRDLNAINAIDNLATSTSDTFLTATPYTVRDMNQNSLAAVTADSALQIGASDYTRDTTLPFLERFTLDMSLEQLILTFSETVSSNIDATQITIQSEISTAIPGLTSVTLTGGRVSREEGTRIVLQLEEDDANELKRIRSIATMRDNTYVWITSSTIQDPAGNSVRPIPGVNALQANLVIEDTVSPILEIFSLDLDQRQLVLFFDETVDSATFTATFVTLQDSTSDPLQSVQLGSFSRTNSNDGTQLLVELSDADFNAITATFPLATMNTNTYISLRPGTVRDTAGVVSSEIPPDGALLITSLTADRTRPSLDEFDFDLDGGVLTLFFSESINVTSFDATQITIQSSSNSPLFMYTLRGGLVTQRESTVVDVSLLRNDLNEIKRMTDLASIRSNTYISITSAIVADMNNNLVFAVSMSDAQLVRTLSPDVSGPVIEGFDLDYGSGDLTLYFDETVDLSTLSVNGISLQNIDSGSGMDYTLQNSVLLGSGLETFIQVRLSKDDLNELKRLRICTTMDTCFLSTGTNAVMDVSGNSNVEISRSSARPVGTYMPDLTSPQVENFINFDLNEGRFMLEFTETVSVSTLNTTQITLDDDFTNATFVFELVELTTTGGDNFNVTFQIESDNLNDLKLNTDLCTYDGNCWIRLTDSFIEDASGNRIVAIVPDTIDIFHRPQVYTPDVTPPLLLSFTIDLNSGMMTFTFNEVVRLGTFTPMNITFQDDAYSPSFELNLREYGRSNRSENGLVIDWIMTNPDLNLLKSYEYLFSSAEDSFLTHSNFIEDISGTGVGDRAEALAVSFFAPDTIRPQLQSFKAFNFDNWTLTLQYDEPVNISSIDLRGFAITQNETFDLGIYDLIPINDWYSVLYENGTIYNLTHTFERGEYVFHCPFSLVPTAEAPSNTPTTMMPTATFESGSGLGTGSGLGSGSGSGNGSSNATMDDESPTTGTVSTPDDEDFYPLLLRGCRIYRNLTVKDPFYFLTGGTPSYIDERKQQVLISLNRVDLRILKLDFTIASNDSDTWIAYNQTALEDMAGNDVIPTNLFNATKVESGNFVDDVTPPILEFIVLDMDASLLSLHFSDVMDIQSVRPLLIEISEYPGSNNSYALEGPYPYPISLTVDMRDNYTVNIPLSFNDMNNLKNNLDLATTESNTYVSFPNTIATDVYGRYPVDSTLTMVQELIPDETGPVLLGFDLDYDARILNLVFDEVVNPNTVVHTRITIQNFQNSSFLDDERFFESHTFIEGGIPVDNSTGVTPLQLVLDLDMNALIINPDLGVDVNDSYITIEVGTVLDMNNNPNQGVNPEGAIQVNNITEDMSAPSLEYFDLNLNDNYLLLKFSESVNLETLNISGITIQSSVSASTPLESFDSVTLSQNSRVIPMGFNSLLRIQLTEGDEEDIKNPRSPLAKSAESTFLVIERDAAENYVNIRVLNISEDDALEVRQYFEGETVQTKFYLTVDVSAFKRRPHFEGLYHFEGL